MGEKLVMKWWFWLFVLLIVLSVSLSTAWTVTAIKGEYKIAFEFDENMKDSIVSMEKTCEPTVCPKTKLFACFKDNLFSLDSKTNCDRLGWEWKEIPSYPFT